MRVLVADDDPVFRALVQRLLQEWRFDVVIATDGAEAWEILRRDDAPRLVLLDWMMPGMDGYEVCKMMRDLKGRKNLYVMMVTGGRKKDDIMKVVLAGADDYLIKPFDPVDLKIRLRNAMRVLHLQEDLDELKRRRQGQTAKTA
ncbi:MAG: response regulator transcription factor [Phycisphaerae bacterium]|nr:response regulator transcription factor [Phycisphaerae bacterium]